MFKSLKVNLVLLLSSLFVICAILYLTAFLYFNYISSYNAIEVIKYKEEINFIEKYTKKLHHIRHYSQNYYKKERKISNLLFSVEQHHKKINEKENINFLFMGDSWFEQLISYSSSRALINSFFDKKKINYINASISSYSPTLMTIQYKILKNDFKINPDYVVLNIDQTDFGDELCRYKKNRYYNLNNNELIGVKPDLIKIPKILELSKIASLNSPKIIKEIKIFNFFLHLKYKLVKNEILKKIGKGQREYGCSLNEIFSYLITPSKEDLNYFNHSVKNFFDLLNNVDNIKKILIVTFPHRNQISTIKNLNHTSDYKFNVSNLIDDYLKKQNNKKFQHLNFTELIKVNKIKIIEKNFIKNDQSSHLNEDSHLKIFTKNIIAEIDKLEIKN
jgi:hypothetical protein|tara:strand:- start:74 stop:1243 length:1170 start_codon:yes stop_codon:yes gene_type:complete